MKLIFAERAWEDYLYWQAHDRQILKRVNELIRATARQPFEGIGKPEALHNKLTGYWSRRIDREHRFVYQVTDEGLVIVQLRYHYE